MAGVFGAGHLTDAYLVALIVPSLLSAIFVIGLGTVMVSILGEYVFVAARRSQLQEVVWSMFHLVLGFSVLLALAVILIMPAVIHLIAPGFQPEQWDLARRLVRIMGLVVILNALIIWSQSVLQISQKFTPPALSNIFFNIAMISAILSSGWFGGIIGVAWGMIGAAATQFLVQIPSVLKAVPPYRLVCNLRHPAIRELSVQTVPVVIRVAAHAMTNLAERVLASRLVVGSISALNFAYMPIQIVFSSLGTPFMTVLNSAMTAFSSAGDAQRYRSAYVRGLRMLSLLFLPMSVLLFVFRADIVRVLFQRGAFDASATQLTTDALIYYTLGLLLLVWRTHTLQSLIAMKDFLTPLWSTVAAMIANTALNVILVDSMAHRGIALGRALGEGVWFACLFWQMRRRLGPMGGLDILRTCGKIACVSLLAGAAAHLLRYGFAMPLVWASLDAAALSAGAGLGLTVSILMRLAVLSAVFVCVFVAACKPVRVAEMDEVTDLFLTHFRKRIKRKSAT